MYQLISSKSAAGSIAVRPDIDPAEVSIRLPDQYLVPKFLAVGAYMA